MTPELLLAVQKFLDTLNVRMAASDDVMVRRIVMDTPGKKNIRLVATDNLGGRSAYGFVDTEGNLLKADGWKRPAKGIRGSIYGNVECCSPWSIR